jgi:alpha-N-arabinofuranosidase
MKLLCANALIPLVFTMIALSLTGEEAVIKTDFTKEQGEISKYIYGQFIEQMGKCIYGGIWAEMLEDRKFFHAVGSQESPWKVQGGGDVFRVIMDEKNPYVGKWTPVLSLEKGGGPIRNIQHWNLAFVAGKQYVGRVVLKAEGEVTAVYVIVTDAAARKTSRIVATFKPSAQYAKHDFRFTAAESTGEGELSVGLKEKGKVFVGAVSLMPADNVHGMRADTLGLIRELNSPIYRWPGGNFVSGYNWKDAIGDPDKRAPRKNPAWEGIEHNDFGIDEFMTFCRLANTEPLIVVNSGQGDVQLATDELEYCNGSPDSRWGKARAENGHREPYNVKWWGIGNEMYGDWQLGHIPVEQYVKKHNEFAEKMRAMDTSIKLIAVGSVGPWDEAMLANCADHMDYLSEHFYVGRKPNLAEDIVQARDEVRRIVGAVRKYHETIPVLKGKKIPIALDEYNYWHGPEIYGQGGVRFQLRDGIGIALALHEMFRNNDILYMANMAQTVNVLGAIKTTKTHAAFDTVALPLVMYRNNFGSVRVKAEAAWPLDAVASLSEDRKTAYIGIVNASAEPVAATIKAEGLGKVTRVKRLVMTGPDENSYNEPGKPPTVAIREDVLPEWAGNVLLDKLSLTVFCLGRH